MAIQTNIMSAGAPLVAAAANQGAQQKNRIREAATTAGTQAAAQERNIQAQQGMLTEKLAADKANTDSMIAEQTIARREEINASKLVSEEQIKATQFLEDSRQTLTRELHDKTMLYNKEADENELVWHMYQMGMAQHQHNEMVKVFRSYGDSRDAAEATTQKALDIEIQQQEEAKGTNTYVSTTLALLSSKAAEDPKLKWDSDFYKMDTYMSYGMPVPKGSGVQEGDLRTGEIAGQTGLIAAEDKKRFFRNNAWNFFEETLSKEQGLEIPGSGDTESPKVATLSLLDSPEGFDAEVAKGRIDAWDVVKVGLSIRSAANFFKSQQEEDPLYEELYKEARVRETSLHSLFSSGTQIQGSDAKYKTVGALMRFALPRIDGVTPADQTAKIIRDSGVSLDEAAKMRTSMEGLTDPSIMMTNLEPLLDRLSAKNRTKVTNMFIQYGLKKKELYEGAGASPDYNPSAVPTPMQGLAPEL